MLLNGKDLVDVRSYRSEDWEEAFDAASGYTVMGKVVVTAPQARVQGRPTIINIKWSLLRVPLSMQQRLAL